MALFHRPLPRNLEAAIRDLDEKNASIRRSAIRDLCAYIQEQTPSRIIDALLRALRDQDPIVRMEAAYGLGDAKASQALPALLLAVDDVNSVVRQAAIDALGVIGDSRAAGRLFRALEDARPDVRFQAVIALVRVSPESGLDAVLRAIEDEDRHVRYIAVRMVEEMATQAGDSIKLPERVEGEVSKWLGDSDEHVCLAVAILLGRLRCRDGSEHLLNAIFDRISGLEPEDEAAAIELAGELDLREAIPGLERRAFGWSRFVKERHAWMARVALARMGHERAKQAIVGDLHSRSKMRRTAAVVAVARSGILEAYDTIVAMRGDEQRAEQEAVEEALELLGGLERSSRR